MSAISVEITFDDIGIDSDRKSKIAGTVAIKALESCECRRMELRWRHRPHDSDDSSALAEGTIIIGKWLSWTAGKTESYPFAVESTHVEQAGAKDGEWQVQAIAHLTGEFQPATTNWLPVTAPAETGGVFAAEAAATELTNTPPEMTDKHEVLTDKETTTQEEAAPIVLASVPAPKEPPAGTPTDASSLLLKIELDKADRTYSFGKWISGKVSVKPDRDYQLEGFAIRREWRTHGRTSPKSGGAESIRIPINLTWKAAEYYNYRFEFRINDGPATVRGRNYNLDWYLRPEIELAQGQPREGIAEAVKAAEEEFLLVPGGRLRISRTASPRLHSWQTLGAATVISVFGLVVLLALIMADRLSFNSTSTFIGVVLLIAGGWAAREAYKYKLAQLLLGSVILDIYALRTSRGVCSKIQLEPRRDVFINRIEMRILVQEVVTIREGTSTRTKKHTLFRESASEPCAKAMKAGTIFEGEVLIDGIPVSVPTTSSWESEWDDGQHSIIWTVTVVVNVKNWFNWQQTIPISVADG